MSGGLSGRRPATIQEFVKAVHQLQAVDKPAGAPTQPIPVAPQRPVSRMATGPINPAQALAQSGVRTPAQLQLAQLLGM